MTPAPAAPDPAALAAHASAFAALGDPTRLHILSLLSAGEDRSIVSLADSVKLTRQGTAKHLKVMEQAGIVVHRREGRETRYTLQPATVAALSDHLARVAAQWDAALGRLEAFVDGPPE